MDTFIENLAGAINAPVEGIRSDSQLADLPNWDSLAILTTLSMVDFEYAITVTGLDLQNCRTVLDVYELIQQRKGGS